MVDDRVPGAVENVGQYPFGESHADRMARALPEGASGRLDPWRMAEFGMAGGATLPLPKVLYFVE